MTMRETVHNLMGETWARVQELLNMAWIKGIVATAITVLVGGWGVMHTAFTLLLIVDLIFGVWRAWREGKLDPRVARNKTLTKLGLYWLLLIAAYQVDQVVPGEDFAFIATLSYLALTEFLSVLRNASAIYGRPITPMGWKRLLDELNTGEFGTPKEVKNEDPKARD